MTTYTTEAIGQLDIDLMCYCLDISHTLLTSWSLNTRYITVCQCFLLTRDYATYAYLGYSC